MSKSKKKLPNWVFLDKKNFQNIIIFLFFSSVKGKFFLTFSRGNYRMSFTDLDQGTEMIIFESILTTFEENSIL